MRKRVLRLTMFLLVVTTFVMMGAAVIAASGELPWNDRCQPDPNVLVAREVQFGVPTPTLVPDPFPPHFICW
jgi:hypothetical protein